MGGPLERWRSSSSPWSLTSQVGFVHAVGHRTSGIYICKRMLTFCCGVRIHKQESRFVGHYVQPRSGIAFRCCVLLPAVLAVAFAETMSLLMLRLRYMSRASCILGFPSRDHVSMSSEFAVRNRGCAGNVVCCPKDPQGPSSPLKRNVVCCPKDPQAQALLGRTWPFVNPRKVCVCVRVLYNYIRLHYTTLHYTTLLHYTTKY